MKVHQAHANSLIVSVFLFVSLPCALAGSTSLAEQETAAWVLELSGGPAWASGRETQTLTLKPAVKKTYTADEPGNASGEGHIFLGMQKPLYGHHILGQLGFDLAAAGPAALSGDIWDDANPEFDNASYQYEVNRRAISLESRFLVVTNLPVIPWISAGAGIGFNNATGFTNESNIGALPDPNFASNTMTSFTYALAVGLQSRIAQHWQIGVSYEFADWGRSELGRADGQTIGSGLAMSHFYSNALSLNIMFVS